MERFTNLTTAGNEPAIRRGVRVPDGAVNLAWIKSPRLTPDKNVVIVDTSRTVPENLSDDLYSCKIMYANSLGVLEDENGNQVVQDEFPTVSDTFSINEDFLTVPGSEYKPEHILPYLHTSRHFHLDFPGLTLGTIPQTFRDDVLKVVDEDGREYLDDEGNPRYRIQITPANVDLEASEENAAYRVFAFIDSVTDQNLYLTYNKVEVTAEGTIENQDIGFTEILNPQPYFLYQPEESDVVDPRNRNEKWYSTKPVTLKRQILSLPHDNVDGYKVYVPKKAIGDPRIFQLFRWRVECTFTERSKVDIARDATTIRVGVLATAGSQSLSPYTFYNLQRSDYNANEIRFINPLKTDHSSKNQRTRAYWRVNFDTVTNRELSRFDVLVLAPESTGFKMGPYLAKIRYFVKTLGKTLILDTGGFTKFLDLGPEISVGVHPVTGATYAGFPLSRVNGPTIEPNNPNHEVFDADGTLGGWTFKDHAGGGDEWESMTPYRSGSYGPYVHDIHSMGDAWTNILDGMAQGSVRRSVLARRKYDSAGSIWLSTIGVTTTVNRLFSHINGKKISNNKGAEIYDSGPYNKYLNSYAVEGAYKLLYNIVLLAMKGIVMNNNDDKFSTNWTFSSPWKASWAIDGKVLTTDERAEHGFKSKTLTNLDSITPGTVYARRLSTKSIKRLVFETMTERDKQRVEGMDRKYRIRVTNSDIETPLTLADTTVPEAWTRAYSPPFQVPIELGPHAIREELIEGDYEDGQYTHRSYPSRPYKLRVITSLNTTAESLEREVVTVTAHGTAKERIVEPVPVRTTNTDLSWAEHGSDVLVNSSAPFEAGTLMPRGIVTWQQANYYNNAWGTGNRIWPYNGIMARLAKGSTGELVMFLQEAFNRCIYYGFFQSGVGYLKVDGYYGNNTAAAVLAFQNEFNARYKDAVVDAETWSILGNQILRMGPYVGPTDSDHTRFFHEPARLMKLENISDDNDLTSYRKRSWVDGGPSIIWELVAVRFNSVENIHGITLTPALEGAAQDMMWRSIDVRTIADETQLRSFLSNYDSRWGRIIYQPFRPINGRPYYVPVGPWNGNTIIVGIGQDKGTGVGTSRMLGIRDLVAHARTTTGGFTRINERDINITYTITKNVKTGQEVVVQAKPDYSGSGTLSNIEWNSVSKDNAQVAATITNGGVIKIWHNQLDTENDTHHKKGPILPGTDTFYSRTEEKPLRLNFGKENGWIKKTDGIKLLCKKNGDPYGFPEMPTDVGAHERQRHYATLSISRYGTHSDVVIGFYDINRKEFILSADGDAEMSYIEYTNRGGRKNIYIGIISKSEVITKRDYPDEDDAPPLPYKWAMPVYGVCSKLGSHIGIEPLKQNLGSRDMWSVPIRTGQFSRRTTVRRRSEGALSGWIQRYAGQKIQAFYGVPEADVAGWSRIYGRPNVDIVGETPSIVDDNQIQIAQAPILMIKEPTVTPSPADPVRPVFTVYTRPDVSSSWTALGWEDILDYNVHTGTITLRDDLVAVDQNLVKVDYTSTRDVYHLKQWDGDRLNLNPYSGDSHEYIGRPIYVYIVPEYVKDSLDRVIVASVQEKTVRFTTDNSIFDSLSPNYDPLAVQLGVAYITTALDIDDLTILDTRRRGGGVKDSASQQEINRIVQSAFGYWDINHGAGISYQKAGFVIIRLPEELKAQFPDEKDITTVIERNITAGVKFKIENLQGENWNDVSFNGFVLDQDNNTLVLEDGTILELG